MSTAKASRHILHQIRNDPRLAALIGPGSESFALLIDEVAQAQRLDVEAARRMYSHGIATQPWPSERDIQLRIDSAVAAVRQAHDNSMRAAIDTLVDRANAVLDMEHTDSRSENISFWRGYAKALRSLFCMMALNAAKEAASSDLLHRSGKTASTSDAVGLELYTVIQAEKRMETRSTQCAINVTTGFKLLPATQIPHAAVAIVQLDDDQAKVTINVNDGAVQHDSSFAATTIQIVMERGAAC